jgi:hypothetical protein
LFALLHYDSTSIVGGGKFDAAWADGAEVSAVGGAAGLLIEASAFVVDAAEEGRG